MNVRLALPVLLFILPTTVFAQSSPALIDSLIKRSKVYQKKDSVRVEILVSLADVLATADPKEAMHYADKASQLAQEIKSPYGIAIALRQKGSIYYTLSDYNQAVTYNYEALRAADDLKKNNRGSQLFVATIYNNLGTVLLEMHDYKRALINFNQFLTVVRKLNEPVLRREESIALLNIGETYSRTGNNNKTIENSSKSLAIAEADRDYQIAAYNLHNQGIAYINLKQYVRAIDLFKKGVLYADKASDISIKTRCLGGVSDALYHLEQFALAEPYAEQAYGLAKQLKILELQRQTSELLTYIYIGQKKSKLADHFLEITIVLRDSLFSDDKKQELARREERFTRDKSEAVLKTQHNAELNQQRTQQNFITGGAGVLMLFTVFGFILYKRRRDSDERVRAEQYNALVAETKLRALRSQINPHFISNALSAIGNYVLHNDALSADRYLTKFAHLMRSILTNSEEEEVSLAEDIETLESYMQLENLRLDHPFTYQVDIDPLIDVNKTQIPPLLLQPFVENSIWHGLAPRNKPGGHILIQLHRTDNMLLCTVTDNGVGRQKALGILSILPKRKSYGIRITKDRIDIINHKRNTSGFVKLSDLSQGTEVAVGLPLVIV